MADRVGQRLGNYRLVRLIGQGGFAEVYLGEHVYLDMPAAIKVLHAQLTSEDAEHFRREARTIARLIHPHIVRVLEFGIEDTTPFLVVDFAPNGTLRKLYRRGDRLPLTTVVNYVNQVADALQYAHDQKVIHRDVKPENMLLGRRYEVLLSDFGIALVAQSTRRQSTQDMQDLAGTIAYMAPEQIQSNAGPASDQYSLAVVAYEWLSGERPFHGTFTEIAVKHTLVAPPPLREKVPALPVEVEEVVMKALSKDPHLRFPSVKAFAEALEQAWRETAATTTTLSGSSFSDAPALPTRPNGMVDQGSAPASLLSPPGQVLPSTSSLSDVASPMDGPESDLNSAGRTVPLDDEEVPSFVETLATPSDPEMAERQEALATPMLSETLAEEEKQPEPEKEAIPVAQPQRKVSRRAVLTAAAASAAVLGAGAALAWFIYGRESQIPSPLPLPSGGVGTTLYTYTGHNDLLWSVVWSPDGKFIASAGKDKTVQVWNASNGVPVYTYMNHTDTVYGLAWSPDSKRVASASYDQTVQIWNAADGYYPLTYNGHTSWVWTVAWAPNGRSIASAGGDRMVQVWNASSSDTLYSYPGHMGNVYGVAWSPDSKRIVSVGNDRSAQVWNATNGANSYTYHPYPNASVIWSVAWSPDGQRIAIACEDKTVQVWDAVGGDHRFIYYGHNDFVYAVAWSPDGKHIASAGDDKTVQIWDATNGDQAYIYSGHTKGVRAVSWSPDGTRIASASWDKTVKVWVAKV